MIIVKYVCILLAVLVIVIGSLCCSSSYMQPEDRLTIRAFSGKDAKCYFKEIANLRIEMFKEFPYLYEGSIAYEEEYLSTYFNSKNSIILLVFNNDTLVGFSNSIPLEEEMQEIKNPFIAKHLGLKNYLYIGEVMIQNPYRGKGLLRRFFEYHEKRAAQKGYHNVIFMTIKRSVAHDLRPKDYRELEPIWQHFGYDKMKDMDIELSWKQIDSHKDEVNHLEIWFKKL